MSRALITGITGFAGSHLADHLLEKGLEVYGIQRRRSKQDNILHIRDWIKLIYADLSDSFSIEEAIKEAQPDYVFHLAAQAYVPMSLIAPEETMQTNVIGTINMFKKLNNVLIIDEVSMLSNEEKDKIILNFKGCKIIFCGDVGFQLPCFNDDPKITKTPFKIDGMKIIEYTINHRVQCEKLGELLREMREHIKDNKNPGVSVALLIRCLRKFCRVGVQLWRFAG